MKQIIVKKKNDIAAAADVGIAEADTSSSEKNTSPKAELTAKIPQSVAKKRSFFKRGDLSTRKANKGWLFVLPFVIGLLAIYIPIVLDSIFFSFSVTIPGRGADTVQFVGFQHYNEALFASETFVETLGKGVLELVLNVPAIVIFSLFIAVILNQKMLGRAAFRAIFFIPVILATGMMETIDAMDVFSDSLEGGVGGEEMANEKYDSFMGFFDITTMLSSMKVGSGLVTFVLDLVERIYEIINDSGVQMLIFLAGLQSISPSIYEACQIEGATSWETFWKITIPMISPMILVNLVYTIIDSFTKQSNIVMKYIKTVYSSNANLSTAMSWIYFVIVLLVVAVFWGIMSAFVFYQKRD